MQNATMTAILISATVLIATCIQAVTSAREVGRGWKSAVEWWGVEDTIVQEQRWWWQRWVTRRELRSWRDPETARGIRHVQMVLVSWLLLMGASFVAFVRAVMDAMD